MFPDFSALNAGMRDIETLLRRLVEAQELIAAELSAIRHALEYKGALVAEPDEAKEYDPGPNRQRFVGVPTGRIPR